jgi:hypothetical protein
MCAAVRTVSIPVPQIEKPRTFVHTHKCKKVLIFSDDSVYDPETRTIYYSYPGDEKIREDRLKRFYKLQPKVTPTDEDLDLMRR